jgi:hypothetical protein
MLVQLTKLFAVTSDNPFASRASPMVQNVAKLSSNSDLERVMNAARTPGWSLGLDRLGQIMATSDAGDIGLPWVVIAAKSGRGLRVSKYQPGDDVEVEGDVIGEVSGNPREMGRQLRDLLADVVCD